MPLASSQSHQVEIKVHFDPSANYCITKISYPRTSFGCRLEVVMVVQLLVGGFGLLCT